MKKCLISIVLAVVVLSTIIQGSGCQTYGEAGGLGAALGAATGAIIGNQSGHALEGAAIGGVLGGIAGLVAHDIKAQKAKSAKETEQQYNYQAAQGERLTFERAEVLPNVVIPGDTIETIIQYALLGAGSGTNVTETRSLIRGDQVVADLSSSSFTRNDGTWVSSQEFRLPPNLAPGQYTLLFRVSTNLSSISGRANFIVD
ncbi:MAG TPA: glycine zipper domain-containing protein [Candidatus Hydrogenedens sp.]|nr:glycine zipper domain-containing protein [Candidatus Hydrogenedens sp.]